MKEARTIRLLLPLLRGYGWALPVTILLGIASSLAESVGLSLFVPLFASLGPNADLRPTSGGLQTLFQFVLSHVPPGNPLPYIVGLIILLTLSKAALTFGHSVLVSHISAEATHSVRSRLLSSLMRISQAQLDRTGTARLVNLLGTDTWHTGDAISLFVGLVIHLCSVAVFSMLLLALSWKLTLLMACGVVVVSGAVQLVTAGARRLGQQAVKANTILSENMLDALHGIREIQMFDLYGIRQRLFDEASRRVKAIYFRLDLLHRSVSPLSEILYVSLLLGLLLIGVRTHGSVPNIIVFLLVLYRLQPQIRQLDAARLSLVSLTASVEEVTRFAGCKAACKAAAGKPNAAVPTPEFARSIEFDRVSFSYGDEFEFRLANLSFQIPAGLTTAIVGRSGSGKSSLIRLLCRFYEPVSGAIYVDGKALAEMDSQLWRERIAWVSQEAYLFQATVFDNILYGRLSASRQDVTAASILAGADEFIQQLPEGYATKVGTGGVELSGGQLQRIALARAFLRDASILILDEATNALDSLSEDSIQERLRKLEGRYTVIVISHRLSTVRHADRVLVIEDGRITEHGTPAQLSAGRGFFARMKELQHVDF